MITYLRIVGPDATRYRSTSTTSNKILFVKPSRVPAEVLQKMTEFDVDKVAYDEHPELPRCLFCDGYKEHQRVFEGAMIDLCKVHYYAKTIGQIAQELRSKGQTHGILPTTRAGQKEQSQSR